MSTQDEAILKAVGQEIDAAGHYWLRRQADKTLGWGDVPDEVFAKAAIRAYLSALDKAGWVVTTHSMTSEMRDAADEALSASSDWATRERSVMAWEAAIAASPPPPGADTSERQP
jgi:hypothetical protein